MVTNYEQYNYLYVMDFNRQGLYEIRLDETDDFNDTLQILDRYGFHESECNYMYSEEKLNLETKEPLYEYEDKKS